MKKPITKNVKSNVKADDDLTKEKKEIDIIDEMINDLNKIELVNPNLNLPGDILKEKEEKKTISILKKVDGALNYFLKLKKDKEKSQIPKYLYDLTIDTLYLGKCQNIINICYTRLPIIVINQEYNKDFKEFLIDYYQYEKYKENKNLLEYLILGSDEIEGYEPIHEPQQYDLGFLGEIINTGLIKHYEPDKVLSIHNKLKSYFKRKNIKGISIDFYYDEWISTVMNIFSCFILFERNGTVKAIKCNKCKKYAYFISLMSTNSLHYKIYEDMENNETYEKSVDIANNMINNIKFSYIALSKNDKKRTDNSLVNIIYFDQGINDHRNEIISDSFIFEKECGGTLLLVTSIKSMTVILEDIAKTNAKFHLISTGSDFESLIEVLNNINDLNQYITAAIIYTYNITKYSYLKNKHKIIKGIYSETKDIIDYIRSNRTKDNIEFKSSILITYNKYKEKYIEFHKIISRQYGKLYQLSSYLTALNLLEEYLMSNSKEDKFDLNAFLKSLEVFSKGSHDYKKIIKEYTNDSFYASFNRWLYQVDPLAIKKIAFFVSGLQLSLNIYGKKDRKGFNCKSEIYRGARLNYSLILNYQRNVGKIITFPSFLSATLNINVAKQFSNYDISKELRDGKFSTNYIININPNNDWIAQGFNISGLSFYKNEDEILFQPFCFFIVHKVDVNLNKNTCDIYMELIGKKEIWEEKMNENSTVDYKEEENFIKLND